MRYLLLVSWVVAGCIGKDEGGCPLEPVDAVGDGCGDEGKECYEFSLCDPCTSDLSDCEWIRCEGGQWIQVDPPTTCAGG